MIKKENLPEGIDPKDVEAKIAAGLTQEQAIEVLLAQKANDEKESQTVETAAPKKTLK